MFNISICDDDPYMRDQLKNLIHGYFIQKQLDCNIRLFSSGDELDRFGGRTDIAFLDVEMSGLNGIQTGYRLMNNNVDTVIFIITSHLEYLDQAIDLKVFRYFEKPVNRARLYCALDAVTQQAGELTFLSEHLPVTLREREVVCIYSFDRKTFVVTDTGVIYPTIVTMKEWLKRTEQIAYYSHPHYSYIVNLRYVSGFDDRSIILRLNNGKTMRIDASVRRFNQFREDMAYAMRWRL